MTLEHEKTDVIPILEAEQVEILIIFVPCLGTISSHMTTLY